MTRGHHLPKQEGGWPLSLPPALLSLSHTTRCRFPLATHVCSDDQYRRGSSNRRSGERELSRGFGQGVLRSSKARRGQRERSVKPTFRRCVAYELSAIPLP